MSYVPLYSVNYSDSTNLDAFSRLRVSQNNILLSSQFIHDDLPLVWDMSASNAPNTASYCHASASVCLELDTVSGSSVARQTKEYYLYRTGQSQLIFNTFSHFTPTENVCKRVGYFDTGDGIFLETYNGNVNFVVRSSVNSTMQESRISQSAWNIDTFDGTGKSGFNMDFSKAQILVIDFQWLGVGRVRCGFDLDGVIYYGHEFKNANERDQVYMASSSLPVRYEITNLDTVSVAPKFYQICSSVIREGGRENKGILCAVSNFNSGSATTTPRTILSVRLRDKYCRARLEPILANVSNRGNAAVRYRVVMNPTLTAGTLTWVDRGQTLQKSTDQLEFTEGTGQIIANSFVPATNQSRQTVDAGLLSNLMVVSDMSGSSDILCIVVDSQTGTQDVDAGLQVLELF